MKVNTKIIVLLITSYMLGFFVFKSNLAGVLASLASLVIWFMMRDDFKKDPYENRRSENDTKRGNLILLLAAYVMKSDGRIYPIEREIVQKKFEHDFGINEGRVFMQKLDVCLTQKINIEGACHNINYNFLYAERVQLLHFLIGIAVSNGILVEAELENLRKIARLIEVPAPSFKAMMSMFSFEYKQSHDSKSKQNNSKKEYQSSGRTSTSKLELAYTILELTAGATDNEVKKAYRRLAKIHHPDRSIQLGPQFQKSAKEKFQKLQDAYETIKKTRGIK